MLSGLNGTWIQVYLTIFSTGNARYGCGGSIITRKHVLTSAQCLIPGERIAKIEVNYGSCDLNLTEKVEVEAVLVRTAFHSVRDIGIAILLGYFGGPRAIQSTDGRYVQIGIAANLGTSCRIGNVITRIDVFMPWIEKMIGVRSAYQNLPSYAPLVTGVARLSPFMFTPDLPGLEPWYF
ncbi:hypothetical protein V5799_012160 [Amblyomma americanum]|uniref:Peptidase S1 domain-containing protein n=1 Tax=Amblyomma americanum TaxID=6943 RepID=A0AAQ4EES9_AMBAM